MTVPPALLALFIPAGLFAAWLYLHKDADIEDRIDKKEAVTAIESAQFDRDFARITGDKEGLSNAENAIIDAKKRLHGVESQHEKRRETDKRGAVRDGVDEFLRNEKETK